MLFPLNNQLISFKIASKFYLGFAKLPPRTCPRCSVPEPYRSHDWALVPASPASKAEY